MTFTDDRLRFDDLSFDTVSSCEAGPRAYVGMLSPGDLWSTFGLIEDTLLVMPPAEAIAMVGRLGSRLSAVETQILAANLADTGSDRDTENLAAKAGKTSKKQRKKATKRAKAARNNPELTDELANGDISEEQLDQLADADEKTDGAASRDEGLREKVRGSNPDQSGPIVKDFVNNHNSGRAETEHERQRRLRSVSTFRTKDGLHAVMAQGDQPTIEAIWKLLGQDADSLYNKDGGRDVPNHKHPRTTAQRLFDAFAARMTGSKGSGTSGSGSEIVLTATAQPDGTITDPQMLGVGPVPQGVFDRYLCTSTLVGAVFDGDGQNLWLGRTKRLATRAQLTGLRARDKGCVLCAASYAKCQAHHLRPYNAPVGGHTNIDELALVCTDCHHLIHDTKQTLYKNDAGVWALRPATPDEIAPTRPKDTPRPKRE